MLERYFREIADCYNIIFQESVQYFGFHFHIISKRFFLNKFTFTILEKYENKEILKKEAEKSTARPPAQNHIVGVIV